MATQDSSFPAPYLPVPPPRSSQTDVFNLDNKVSPSVLLIIVVLAIIFFVSGLLHMLVRLFLRPAARDHYDLDSVTAFQGQLQQLFHLHDAGLDQHFVDTLPLFQYKTIIGLDNQFDCAVCLCEFEPEDKLRLLPKCSHAFHVECIDAWLLSHSTCPLCRASLIPEFTPLPRTPLAHLLESRSDVESGERNRSGSTDNSLSDNNVNAVMSFKGTLVAVKLGKYKVIDMGEEDKVTGRRCYSMGSFEYVTEDNSQLKVHVRTPTRKQPILPLMPGCRPAMSERYPESRMLQAFDGFNSPEALRDTRKGNSNPKEGSSSRNAFSFRIPMNNNEDDEESQCNNIKESSIRTHSFARRTFHWLAGRQNKIVHSPVSSLS